MLLPTNTSSLIFSKFKDTAELGFDTPGPLPGTVPIVSLPSIFLKSPSSELKFVIFPNVTSPFTLSNTNLTLSVLSVAIVSASRLPKVKSLPKFLAMTTVLPDFTFPKVTSSLMFSKFTLNLAFIWVLVVTVPTVRAFKSLAVKFIP